MSEGSGAETIAVPDAHRFNEARLIAYLRDHLALQGDVAVRQFQAGQSNPTYKLIAGERTFVLRKRPGGSLLPSAHAVDREYKILSALQDTDVPVPAVLLMCEDPDIIGTDFFVMEMIDGDIHHDPGLPGLPPEGRRAFYEGFVKTLAALHSVDFAAQGLGDFGKPNGYLQRQVSRWSNQYESSQTEDIPAMAHLVDWLPANVPDDPSVSIVHGDYRPGNVIVSPDGRDIRAVLDWELSTLGHPLADLGYCLASYHGGVSSTGRFHDLDHAALGIPTQSEFIDLYRHHSGRDHIDDVRFYVVFSLFRSAAIIQGVYKRALNGNASSAEASGFGHLARQRAETAWRLVENGL